MSTNKKMTLHEKAVRLCEGGVVEINGHFVRALDVARWEDPCYLCDMDSVCDDTIGDLCAEVDKYTCSPHILIFANKK